MSILFPPFAPYAGNFFLTPYRIACIKSDDWAGVVKQVDALDSKSSDPCGRESSILSSGTRNPKRLPSNLLGPEFRPYRRTHGGR